MDMEIDRRYEQYQQDGYDEQDKKQSLYVKYTNDGNSVNNLNNERSPDSANNLNNTNDEDDANGVGDTNHADHVNDPHDSYDAKDNSNTRAPSSYSRKRASIIIGTPVRPNSDLSMPNTVTTIGSQPIPGEKVIKDWCRTALYKEYLAKGAQDFNSDEYD